MKPEIRLWIREQVGFHHRTSFAVVCKRKWKELILRRPGVHQEMMPGYDLFLASALALIEKALMIGVPWTSLLKIDENVTINPYWTIRQLMTQVFWKNFHTAFYLDDEYYHCWFGREGIYPTLMIQQDWNQVAVEDYEFDLVFQCPYGYTAALLMETQYRKRKEMFIKLCQLGVIERDQLAELLEKKSTLIICVVSIRLCSGPLILISIFIMD
jgi:hypothetical protein